MAKRTIRTYYSTYAEIELDDADFKDEHEMLEYARLNTDYIDPMDLYHNTCFECLEQEIL